ncbi:GLPGLI family protein [Ekhidna sp.]|uniref:GLPGLI family protein n=1 Tax=Ekhidna sp. TaxID=2608089 RepID=UPI0032EC5FAA
MYTTFLRLILLFLSFSGFYSVAYTQNGLIKYSQELGLGVDKSAYLVFDASKSIYYFQRGKLDSGVEMEEVNPNEFAYQVRDKEGISFYFDQEEAVLISRQYVFFNDSFVLLEEDIPNFRWEISEETRLISGFLVQKALGTFRGRNYIAWFTREIPFDVGPWKFNGLPGAILEVVDSEDKFSFKALSITYPSKQKLDITPPKKGKKLKGFEEFKQYVKEKATEWTKYIQSKGPGYSGAPDFDSFIEKFDTDNNEE